VDRATRRGGIGNGNGKGRFHSLNGRVCPLAGVLLVVSVARPMKLPAKRVVTDRADAVRHGA